MIRSLMVLLSASAISVYAYSAAAQGVDLPELPAAVVAPEEAQPENLIDASQIAQEVTAEAAALEPEVIDVSGETESRENVLPSQNDEKFIPSYGAFPSSLLFSGNQIDQMKKVLFLTERFRGEKATEVVTKKDKKEEEVDLSTLLPQKPPSEITTPSTFPTYVVSSILYRGANDWVLWLNGERVTPDKQPKGITVAKVRPRSVTLQWSPEDPASFAFHQENLNQQKPSAAVKKVMSSNNSVKRLGTEQWEFTLRPNQTFNARYMAVLEGKNPKVKGGAAEVAVKKMPEPTAEDILRQAGFPQQQGQTMDDKLRGIAGALQRNNRALQGFRPQKKQRSSGFHVDSNLRSDRSASKPPQAVVKAPEPSATDKIKQALPAFLESIGVSPQQEENNAGNEGLPLLPNQ